MLDVAFRVWTLPVWAHVGALVVLMAVIAPFMRLDGAAWVEEEGRLGLQVEALSEGSWDYPYAGEAFDPEHRWSPFGGGSEGVEPASDQPAYASALRGVAAVVGTGAALYLLSMFGVLVAAFAAWLVAAEIDARASRPAFWLVAASPLLVHGYLLWPHAAAVGAVGLAVVGGIRIVRHGLRIRSAFLLLAGLGVGAVLRPEAVYFAGALALAVVVILGARHRWREAAIAGVSAVGATGVVFLAHRRWVDSVGGDVSGFDGLWADAGGSVLTRIEGRVAAAWRFLFDGGNVGVGTERLVLVALVAAVGGGLFLRMRGREGRFVGSTVAVASALGIAVLHGARSGEAPVLPVLGLLAAWPVVLFGLSALPWRRTTGEERAVLGAVAIFGLVVVATLPAAGAEREWGSRLLVLAAVPLGAVVAVGFVRRLAERPWQQRAAVAASLVVLAAFPVTRGLESVREFRETSNEVATEIQSVATQVVVIDNPRLVLTPIFSWRLDDEIDWYVSYGDTRGLLSALAAAGHDEVTVLPDPTRETLDVAPYASAEAVTTQALESRGIPAFTLRHNVSSPVTGSAEGQQVAG